MIVYNVKAAFFAMKEDAEIFRKAEGLPPAATLKVTIENRDELAAFLNGVLGAPAKPTPAKTLAEDTLVQQASGIHAHVEAPEELVGWVPLFILNDWERRAQHAKKD